MDLSNFLKTALLRKKTVILVTALVFALFLVITLIQPLKYRATTKILISQSYSPSADAYVISRSNQFISNVLSQVITSDLFLQDVLSSGFNIDKNIFSNDPQKRQKQWDATNKSVVINDAGIIIINSYNKDRYQAFQINQAIAYILKTKHNTYHGLGEKVEVKVLDKSIVSKFPVKPNIIVNAILGLVLGFIFGLFFSFLKTQELEKKIEIPKAVLNDYLDNKYTPRVEQENKEEEKNYYENKYDDYGEAYVEEEETPIIPQELRQPIKAQEDESIRESIAETLEEDEQYSGGKLEEEKVYEIKDFKGSMSNILRQ